jgi:hypothetical protein
MFLPFIEVLFLKGYPHSPGELFIRSDDWNVEAAVNEEKSIRDYTAIAC